MSSVCRPYRSAALAFEYPGQALPELGAPPIFQVVGVVVCSVHNGITPKASLISANKRLFIHVVEKSLC